MKIGIIGAMESEIVMLKGKMKIATKKTVASLEFYEGTLNERSIVLVKSGIGKVNAAMCAQILIDVFNVEAIINSGVAGALHPDLDVGDIVIGTEVMQHDIDASIFGDPRGVIPGMDVSIFKTDRRFLDACDTIKGSSRLYKGRILTGDQAIGDSATKEYLQSAFNGWCVEMEGGAIAHVCHLNKIPFMVIRAISDKANEDVELDYSSFMAESAKKSCVILEKMLLAM
ncbi:5'-methylthioadenosine/adenosylhomocysteine nucleosidase [Alkalibacter saccharofermentans]|uniref:adenosylhomocysteine nucleosidase n=1 Tax=Alkalibacter saccharofermentans DSM 14828 TaxID=1120975 RepID=A0A1M4TFU3_9FIRM|nr:5'-methylthioadenosine/adenosylhomocysteine nucleosidase [Alkalibacter saccharofermentans]SHE43399.1 adenosylhomocysteine nucleosidase [Alkalibacter saccharofermentans DSM 14828]